MGCVSRGQARNKKSKTPDSPIPQYNARLMPKDPTAPTLKLLAQISPKRVLERLSPNALRDGFSLFRKCAITRIVWSDDWTKITVNYPLKYNSTVTIDPMQPPALLHCDCLHWTPSLQCEHAIAALLTVTQLNTDTLTQLKALNPAYHAILKSHLFNQTQPSAGDPQWTINTAPVAISISPGVFNQLRVNVHMQGRIVTTLRPGLPDSVALLVKAHFTYGSQEAMLTSYLEEAGNELPIFIRTKTAEIPVTFAAKLKVRKVVQFQDTQDGWISVVRRLFTGNTPISNGYAIGTQLYCDLANQQLFLMDEGQDDLGHQAWKMVASFEKSMASDDTVSRVPRENFELDDVTASGNGFDRSLGSFAPIETAFRFPAGKFVPLGFPLPSKTPVTKVLQFFEGKTAVYPKNRPADLAISLSLSPRKNYYEILRGIRIADQFVPVQLLSAAAEDSTFIAYTPPHGWTKLRPIHLRELWTEMATAFGENFGATLPDSLQIPPDEFLLHQVALDEVIKKYSVHVFWGQTEAKMVEVDVSFKVQASGMDWFDISPKLTIDGEPVDLATWLPHFSGTGIVHWNNQSFILSSESRTRLIALAQLMPKGKVTDKTQKVPKLALLDWIAAEKSGIKVDMPASIRKSLDEIVHFSGMVDVPVPEQFTTILRDYQKQGYYWLCFLYRNRLGACLADDMGLGKTVQTLAFLLGIKEGLVHQNGRKDQYPHLIVVPPSLLFNWQMEIEKFAPQLTVHEYRGPERTLPVEKVDIILTTYDIVRRDIDTLIDVPFDVVVFDEVQLLKNLDTERARSAHQLQSTFKLCLSGTPLENHIGEYYSIMSLCVPGLFGSIAEFHEAVKSEQIGRLINRSRPFVMRRTKDKILKELPPKTESTVYLEMNDVQKTLYHHLLDDVKERIALAYAQHTRGRAAIISLTAILRLRQLCLSPRLVYRDQLPHSPKIHYLIEKATELYKEGHSLLVFSQFTKYLEIVKAEIAHLPARMFYMDGKVPVSKRAVLVNDFQNATEPSIFLMSLKTGGVGLNLTKASYVIHLDPWWNPAVESQATDRTHRIGQHLPVFVHNLVMHDTIEEKMVALKSKKKDLYDSVMKSGIERSGGMSNLTKEDFEALLG